MTGKGQRHDRRGARRRHLLVAATVLLVVGGCGGAGEAPLAPAMPEAQRVAMIEVPDIEVRLRVEGEWGQWTTITDSMRATVPLTKTLVLQFRRGAEFSSLAGFKYPELDTCFQMPAHYAGDGAWRLSYGPDPGPYPTVGRIEFRARETHVTQAESRILWLMAELWDDDAAAYLAASPWFEIQFTTGAQDYEFHQGDVK